MKFPFSFRRDGSDRAKTDLAPQMPTVAVPVADTSEAERTRLIDDHGFVMGGLLYEQRMATRAHAVERLQALQAELDAANSALETEEARLLERLPPLRQAMDAAYDQWMLACEAHEMARSNVNHELAPLRQRVQTLIERIRGPLLFSDKVKQWSTPEWAKGQEGK